MDEELALGKRFWDIKYISNQIGWDMGEVSPPIKEYIDQIENKDLAILIPGGGLSHEAEYIAKQGFTNITVLDISTVLVEKLQEKFKDIPAIKIVEGDFFDFKGQFDLIIEQTFFCALYPHHREQYVQKMSELLTTNGRLVGLLFNIDFQGGPPYGGHVKDYLPLFEKRFKVLKMEECYNSHPARKGNELWLNLQKI